MAKVTQFINANGRPVANHHVIEGDDGSRSLQSYQSIVVKIDADGQVFLDEGTWNYSSTTSKHRNHFLGETTKDTQKKIDSKDYIITNLNK